MTLGTARPRMLAPADLEVFYGAADPAAAHVYVRWRAGDPEALRGLTLRGTVRGPFNCLARTLPATVPLADQGPGESLLARGILARGIVPDPCYWVPGAPYTYTVHVAACAGGRVVAETERTLGIRPLGVAGRRFKLAGKGWLPRAIHRDLVAADEADDLAAWRELGAVMIAAAPDDALCRQASEQGVLIFAVDLGDDTPAAIRRLAQWPAVGMIVVPDSSNIEGNTALARNLLFASEVATEAPSGVAGRAHALLLDADEFELTQRAAPWAMPLRAMPIIAARRVEGAVSLKQARAACDALQAELAGRMEIAGLAVLPGKPRH